MVGELRSLPVSGPKGNRMLYYRDGTSDYVCLEQVFKHMHYSMEHFRRHAKLLEFVRLRSESGKRPLIIDAGANIGASAVFYAMSYPGARIVAIEPEAQNFSVLRKNAQGFDIECLNAGLSSSAQGWLKIANPRGDNWEFRTETTADETGIPCVTIDDIYRRECANGTAFPFIVKIDIEGAEADVFSKNTEWLARTPVVVVELHDWLFPGQGTSAGFLKCIAGQPRDFIFGGENAFSIAHTLA
jgi:FkbM family methyltransferase